MSTEFAAGPHGSGAPGLPYAGLRVLDLSQGLAGPYCGMLLGQYGAQVTKLEPPEGDWSRGIGTRHGSHSAIDYMGNRGKHSIAADLKAPGAVDMVRRMAARCDVLIENYRPGIAQRLGLGYEDIARVNPDIIYVSVSGFGLTGEKSRLAATDTVMQGFSGMMALNPDPSGKPQRLGFLAVDTLTALYAFNAVSVALYARRDGAGGRHLDISLLQSTAAFLAPKIVEASLEGASPQIINAPAGVYRTRDGWLAITLSKEAHFAALCKATGRDDLAADPRFASFQLRAPHARHLEAELAQAIAPHDTAHWLASFQAHGVVASRVNTLTDWLHDPHVQAMAAAPLARDGERQLHFPATPGVPHPADDDPRGRWPGVGEDVDAVLADFGFNAQEIAALQADGAIARPAPAATAA
jgi:crotonobetainyl-CoA:carnitine CoA-transferase CaiB-like acyl-CoA transferase